MAEPAAEDADLVATLRYPALQDIPESDREALFIAKLQACRVRCDFSNPRAEFAQKEAKRRHLVDISDYISCNKGAFTEAMYEHFFTMVSLNLFRALPIGTAHDEYSDPEDDEPFLEPAWPHLQIVYDVFRRFVSGDTDQKVMRNYITTRFVLSLVELFNSEDPREREYLKTILHRIYGKIMPLRAFIRRSIMNVFYSYVFETHRHAGVAELLEILGSVINGFAIPLKEEHKVFLRRFLIPLHTPKGLPSYHVQLSFCITQFVEKEPALAMDVITGLVRHWPVTHSRKEVMLLNELEELLELSQPDEFGPVIEMLFRRIAQCIESPHFQVAERALFFWNNEYIVSLILYFRDRIMPIVYGPLRRNVESHWNSNVLSLSYNVQKLLSEMDSMLYEATAAAYEGQQDTAKRERKLREMRWGALCRRAEMTNGRPERCKEVPGMGNDQDRPNVQSARNGVDRQGAGLSQDDGPSIEGARGPMSESRPRGLGDGGPRNVEQCGNVGESGTSTSRRSEHDELGHANSVSSTTSANVSGTPVDEDRRKRTVGPRGGEANGVIEEGRVGWAGVSHAACPPASPSTPRGSHGIRGGVDEPASMCNLSTLL